jgi:dipeptidyl aminopeptidase/acylaminoacyl peptidase
MPLASGSRLGPYEILAPVGAGGMGEVYRARDPRLNRAVAIKVLPTTLAADPAAQARFEEEAHAIAALSHPNIVAIHDVGHDGPAAYAVMELLEGETLRDRLRTGPLPPRKAAEIGRAVALGLAAAHDAGVVHRDIKPENIFLTASGHVKILDFGLARQTQIAPADDPDSPTFIRKTDPGTVMGTLGYMSPEQVAGRSVDFRSDIFSLGCVLYEMVTGARAFERPTGAETMTAILREDVPEIPRGNDSGIASALDRVVRHCLEKQPAERFQSAHDLAFALQAAAGASATGPATAAAASAPRGRVGYWRPLAFTAIVVALSGSAAWWLALRTRPAPPVAPVMRTVLPLGDIAVSRLVGKDDRTIAVSPDGRWLAYVAATRREIRLVDLQTGESRPIVSERDVGEPFFSPDSKFLAYVSGAGGMVRTSVWGSLRKIPIAGGASTALASGMTGIKGASWGDDGWIYYSPGPAFGLWRVPAAGGAAEQLTIPDAANGEKTHRHPFVLPGSRAVLFVVGTSKITSFDDARIEALRLSDRSRHRLVDGGTAPWYLPTGHLLYERAGQLLTVPFDADRLTVGGVPAIVADGIENVPVAGTSYYILSAGGTLFYVPRQTVAAPNTIVAIDDRGRIEKLADAPFAADAGSLSPDGRYLALDPDGATQQIAIVDFVRNTTRRITFEWDNANPLWTPDGSRLIYRSNYGGGARKLYWQAADGGSAPELLSTRNHDEVPTSVSGDRLLFEDLDPQTHTDIWIMSLRDRTPKPLVRTSFDESAARFAPDGRWVAYQSNQSGAWEIYLQPVDGGGRRVQASYGGGVRPVWEPNGRAVLYLKGVDVMRAAFSESAGDVGPPQRLYSLEPDDVLFDIARDGRLIVLRHATAQTPTALTVITNWIDEVRRRATQ